MNFQNDALASTGSACLKKANELFYVVHAKAPKPLLGPFLTAEDAECGRVVMRSPDATVEARQVGAIDEFTYWHAINNGQVMQAFAAVPAREQLQ
ncbi:MULTISPECIES: hypothetical protein [Pseudomonas syringae group]|uniref:Uncharacterized protein n=4 Tax=Pseudomonas syringae group TaxID=136849 RepID=A0A2K4X015_PSESX|nr:MULTISPECIES: hypothetical protein [Pseudomonas syringae group]EGH20560.1 hypothetical protein PSYMO_03288 [Pseudomonas amygdali pv. mori str. 301020]AVB13417.1 hypothetical protein BKM19_007220 [Pseudomonas amygdali pv. morsprunorum]KAA8699646.1 hypothetical protein F4W70_26550 [Pseudomonas cannabina]KPW64753.1 Uncharacterized protein ALO81_02725 [Pseudomonas cannabina]KWS51278.1 hypothetical protein AL056_12055 [Pseudomonas amygdali pv. morsprunorum]